jgi:hypothetical protein
MHEWNEGIASPYAIRLIEDMGGSGGTGGAPPAPSRSMALVMPPPSGGTADAGDAGGAGGAPSGVPEYALFSGVYNGSPIPLCSIVYPNGSGDPTQMKFVVATVTPAQDAVCRAQIDSIQQEMPGGSVPDLPEIFGFLSAGLAGAAGAVARYLRRRRA